MSGKHAVMTLSIVPHGTPFDADAVEAFPGFFSVPEGLTKSN